MKRTKFFWKILFSHLFAITLVACGDDDEPGGAIPGASGSGTFVTDDGRTITLNQGYFALDSDIYNTVFSLFLTDYNVTTIPDQQVNEVTVDIYCDGSSLPEGIIPCRNNGSQLPYWRDLGARDLNPMTEWNSEGEIDGGTYDYSSNDNRGYESASMTITRTAAGYRIEIPSIRLVKNGDTNGREVTGSLTWEGGLADVSEWYNAQ